MAGGMVAVFVLCVAGALVVSVAVRRGRSADAVAQPDAVGRLLAAARRRAAVALGVGAAVFVVVVAVGLSAVQALGLPLLLAAPLAGAAALVVYAAAPPAAYPVGSDARRTASLTPRRMLTFVSPRQAAGPVAALLVLVAFVLGTGVTASADSAGSSRAITFAVEGYSSTATPYAGWFYGLPLIAACVALAAATGFALWRVSTVAALPEPGLSGVDAAWRRQTTRIVAAVGVVATSIPLSGVAAVSGASVLNARLDGVGTTWLVAGIGMLVLGLLALVAAVAALALVTVATLELPARSVRAGIPARRSVSGEPDAGS